MRTKRGTTSQPFYIQQRFHVKRDVKKIRKDFNTHERTKTKLTALLTCRLQDNQKIRYLCYGKRCGARNARFRCWSATSSLMYKFRAQKHNDDLSPQLFQFVIQQESSCEFLNMNNNQSFTITFKGFQVIEDRRKQGHELEVKSVCKWHLLYSKHDPYYPNLH